VFQWLIALSDLCPLNHMMCLVSISLSSKFVRQQPFSYLGGLYCWIWVVNVLFLWKNVFLFHMIGKQIFAFLLMRKKYFDWGRFWNFFYEHNEKSRPPPR
jgi:hypothetical protein